MNVASTRPILVVDDEQTIRLGFSVALSSVGFEVELASSGEQAIEVARNSPPDCVLLDLRMPGLDGLQTAAEIRDGGFEGPIVLSSAFADHRTAVEALRLGITDFLTKPVKPTQLRYAVNHALSRHARFSKSEPEDFNTLAPDLLRAYAKYCLSRRRHAEALIALRKSAAERRDLQSLLLLGAMLEMNGEFEEAGEMFARATELHASSINFSASTELFRVFSHSDHSIED